MKFEGLSAYLQCSPLFLVDPIRNVVDNHEQNSPDHSVIKVKDIIEVLLRLPQDKFHCLEKLTFIRLHDEEELADYLKRTIQSSSKFIKVETFRDPSQDKIPTDKRDLYISIKVTEKKLDFSSKLFSILGL